MSQFIIQTAAAKMPQSCWGTYKRVAVLEVEDGVETVAMISSRARGVVEIVQTWEKLNVGSTSQCAFQKALAEAKELTAELNQTRHLVAMEV